MNNERYKFPKELKIERKREVGCCEVCGNSDCDLQAHHIVGQWYVATYVPELAPALVRSLANMKIVCQECHTEIHNDPQEKEKMAEHAKFLQELAATNKS